MNEAHPARAERFGYTCHRCLRCCHHKRIQLNPYEIARLARNQGVTTGEFRARWTLGAQGTELARVDAGACVFLGAEGCTVHADRPLVCRLYPLGRRVDADGHERYSHLDPHPESAGDYHRDGTIGDYLRVQGAASFMHAADEYYGWWCRFMESLPEEDSAAPTVASDADGLAQALEWLDMDAAVARFCRELGIPEPDDLQGRADLHLKFLHDALAD